VVYRVDGSHSTDLLRHYLTAVSPAWRAGPGDGSRVRWPVGAPATGNTGMTRAVLQKLGAFGYLDRPDAQAGHLAGALLSDGSGRYVPASVAAANTITATVVARLMTGQEPVLLDRAIDAYPLAHVISVDLCRNEPVVADFMRYALTQGQAVLPAYSYGALPLGVRTAALAALR
jgi:phosphate transport system substrate-binding protein